MALQVLEYKDERKTIAPFNVLRWCTYVLYLGRLPPPPERGFLWRGGATSDERRQSRRLHRRLQARLCQRHLAHLAELRLCGPEFGANASRRELGDAAGLSFVSRALMRC